MKDRIILHSDLNSFYASVECLYNPSIRKMPVAVGGDEELRHGIILAKNEYAKKYGVKTAEPIWSARQKCPELVVIKPHYDLYLRFSEIAREIYERYTDKVENFGLDEAWLDVTNSVSESGEDIAKKIMKDIKRELGITVSVGVSFNKIYAKLGSDMKKPNGLTVISRDNYKERIFHLPVSDLLNIGYATSKKLFSVGVYTIGQLAALDRQWLIRCFGKWGEMMYIYAGGHDMSPVLNIGYENAIKSIGNSTTSPRDLMNDTDVKIVLYNLSESVSARMREQGLICKTVQLYVRDKDLHSYERQMQLRYPNRTAKSLAETAFQLFKDNHTSGVPVRSVGVRACDLKIPDFKQLSALPDDINIDRHEMLDSAVDILRSRYGSKSVHKGMMLLDKKLYSLDPRNNNLNFID